MSTLQELLNLGLVDIGSDDSRFDKMQSAASAFATRLAEEPSLIIPATLIAIDDEVGEDDPLFSVVEELVITEWRTLRNTHVNRPRELLRSIIIDSLSTAIHDKPEAAGIVYNTAAGPYKHGQVRLGEAADVIKRLLTEAMRNAEGEAIQRAALTAPKTKKRKRKKPESEVASLDLDGTIEDEDVLGVVSRNPRKFRQPNASPATIASKSMIFPSLRNV